MSDTGSHKLRALFLAAVMVTSVFAGVAGTASAETLDTDDGVSDLRNSTELGVAPDITLSNSSTRNDILINGSSGTNVTFGFNITTPTNRTANFTVVNDSGPAFNSTGNNVSALTNGSPQNGTFNITNGSSSLIPNGESYILNATLVNTSGSPSQITGSQNVTIQTFAIDADNTTDQNFVAERSVEVADLNVNASSPESVTVNLNGTNAANLTSDEISSVTITEVFNDGTTFDNTTNSVTDVENIDTTLQDPDNLTQLRVTATSSSSLDSNVVLDANVSFFTQDRQRGLTTTVDTLGNQSAVSGGNAASIQGTVQSTNSVDNPVDGATVTVRNVDSNSFVTNLTTDSTGDYVGNVGGNANYSVEVTDDNELTLNNFIQRDSDTGFGTGDGFIPTGQTGRIDITLDETAVPTTLNITNVEPSSRSVAADNSTLINVTAEVNDQNGDPLSGVSVDASTPSNTVFFSGPSTKITGQGTQTGNVTFRVFSNESQTVDLQLSAGSTDALDKNATLTFSPVFREAQQGAITGDVRNQAGDKLEDAQVHAVYETRVQRNQENFTLNFSRSPNPVNNTASFRIINLTDGTVVDSDEYAVSLADSDATGNFSFVNGADDARVLNSSDSTVGTGFQVTNLTNSNSGNPDVNLTVTSLATGNLSIQQARTDAPSNNDFSNISNSLSNSFAPSANITFADAKFRSANTNQRLTDETGADGDYDLTQLHTDGSDGFGYFIIVQRSGLSTEIENVGTVDPANSPFEQGTTVLKPRDAPVDNVNITNLGLAESDGGNITEPFENTTDDFAQEVPRAGTFDVVEIETTVSDTGTFGNGTVILEVPDNGNKEGNFDTSPAEVFDGEFRTVENGTEISSGEDTITIATGSNGVARVFLQTDNSTADLNASAIPNTAETGIEADLQGASSTDFTNKSFVGVLEQQYSTGSITGVVTNEDQDDITAEIFVEEIQDEDADIRFEIEPVTRDLNQFNITLFNNATDPNANAIENETVSDEDLRTFTFDSFDANISVANDQELQLLSDEAATRTTLTPVPAVAAEPGVSVALSGVQVITDQRGSSVATTMEINRTSTASIVIQGAEQQDDANFAVSNLTPADVEVGPDEVFNVSATIENTGDLSDTQEIEFQIDGETEQNKTRELSGGENETVTFEIDASDFDPGEFNHAIASEDDEAVGNLTILEEGNFTVSNLTPADAEVAHDEVFDVNATIENTGEVNQTQEIELRLEPDDPQDQNETLELSGGENETVTFEIDASDLDPGEFNHTIASEDDEESGNLTVLQEPIEYESGSITGIVTNEDNEAIQATVFVDTIEDTNSSVEFEIEPDSDALENFTITRTSTDTGETDSVEVTAEDLRAFEFDGFDQPDVTLVEGEDPVTLISDGPASQTTLSPVPAINDGEPVEIALTGVQTESGDEGTSVATEVEVNRTSTASIVIQGADPIDDAPANFTVSDLEPQNATVNVTEAFDVSATVENTGDLQGEQEIELRLEPDGDAVGNQTVTLDAGNSTPVTFEDVTVDTAGEFNHTVASANDSATGSLTVEQREQEQEPSVSVNFTDQTVPNGTEEVTVDSANFTRADGSAGDYVVVVHVVSDEFDGGLDNSISTPVGASGNLSNGAENITVDLNSSAAFEDGDALDSITDNVTLRAMLHTTANDSAFGTRLGNAIDGIEPGDETDDANITVEEAAPEPADFDVSNVTPDGVNVTAGDDITVNADIENVGGQEATQSVEFRIVAADGNTSIANASATATQDVTLNAGANDTVTFENVSTDGLAAGDFTHGVFSENDSATATITVEEAAPEPPTATVTFDNQTVQNGSTSVTVASATFNGSEAFNVVVHQATDTDDDGTIQASEIGKKIGESVELDNGTNTDITVNISKQIADNDNVTQLTENQTLVAMLHTTNTTDNNDIVHTAPITRDGTPVFNQADIGIEPESPLDGVAARFDENADGEIDIGELGQAGQEFAAGDLSITELGQVGRVFAA